MHTIELRLPSGLLRPRRGVVTENPEWSFSGKHVQGALGCLLDTEYDRANVPPYNGNDPPPAPGSLKRSLFPTLLNEVENKGTQWVRARYGAELPPIISIVRCPGRPVISVPDLLHSTQEQGLSKLRLQTRLLPGNVLNK